MKKVKAWEEKVVIPTYETGQPEKIPIFIEKRVYQGSSGVVYPHPVIEKIFDEKVDREWQACYLENDYLKIMILPELGGRVQMAFDKTKNRHFVYYNEVIKPALVGLAGPWISGGIEFNWPQHHRPSTYQPVDYKIVENKDGSKTVWCSEIERMFRTRGMAGFTLYPDKAYLEVKVKLYNRTSQPQTFLWWANPAVEVNDHYQSVFPPDVHAVFDHGKRDVSKYPVATGTYYKMDYSKGVDISLYKNIPVPTSYMAIRSKYDFVGGYDNAIKGGLLHVANHHVSPGKKQWTWGCGDFGKAWDRNLTDQNGPYIELMCGVYTDNQPDFSWLMPYEEKSFSQYFMPYRDLGVVKNATKDAMLNMEFEGNRAIVRIYTTAEYKRTSIEVKASGKTLWKDTFDFSPDTSYLKEIEIDPSLEKEMFYISVSNASGEVIVDWRPEKEEIKAIPEAAKAPKEPNEIQSNEELYLNGVHLEQYRHATYDPTDYYREALRRDPDDIRCNNALGSWLFRRGKFTEAEEHFRKAHTRQITRNPNPSDGEPVFNLGLALRLQGDVNEAYFCFHKSVWNAATMDSGYFQIALIDATRKNWELALENINRSLLRNWHNHKARHLKSAILRKMGRSDEASTLINESLELDGFNFGAIYEMFLLGDHAAKEQLTELIRGNIHSYIEIALDYYWAGMFDEAISLLDMGIEQQDMVYPMAYYYKAWMLFQSGDEKSARIAVLLAGKCKPEYCFPNQIEAVPALQLARILNPGDSKASYYLGNFWYYARQYEDARACFEQSAKQDDTFPIVFRNLALAYYNKFNRLEDALNAMERAFELDTTNARILMELNQLYRKLNKAPDFRLDLLENHIQLVIERDDLYLERIELYIIKRRYREAYEMIMNRKFHPWEGGEGKVSGAYIHSLEGMAEEAMENGSHSEAVGLLEQAKEYPENLGEGKLHGAQENRINYLLGCAYEALHETEKAKEAWLEASSGLSEPVVAWYYNDQQPDTIFYQGLALNKLGREDEALSRFNKLIDYGEKHLFDRIKIDYFAVSLPDLQIWEDDLSRRNMIHCNYLIGLGFRGKGLHEKANQFFNSVLKEDVSHMGIYMLKKN